MTIREKTDKMIETMKEFKDEMIKQFGDPIADMEVEEFAMLKKSIELIDISLDICAEQARIMEKTDKVLDELNCKMDILLNQKD